MPRRVPRVFVNVGKFGQRLKHRRQDKLTVTLNSGENTPADEIRRIFQNPDKVVDLVENGSRNLGSLGAV